jgi:hypothetical protein
MSSQWHRGNTPKYSGFNCWVRYPEAKCSFKYLNFVASITPSLEVGYTNIKNATTGNPPEIEFISSATLKEVVIAYSGDLYISGIKYPAVNQYLGTSGTRILECNPSGYLRWTS